MSWAFARVNVHRLSLLRFILGVFHSLFFNFINVSSYFTNGCIATHSVDPSLTHFLSKFPGLGLALIPDVVVPEAEPGFVSALSPMPESSPTGQWRPGLLQFILYSPSHLSVIGYLKGLMRVAVPPTNLLHPGREPAVCSRLLIRWETHAYLAASPYI